PIMSHLNKIAPNSPSRQNPSEIETSIANALYELENNIQDMRASLRPPAVRLCPRGKQQHYMKTAAIASTNDNAGSSKNVKKEKVKSKEQNEKAQDVQEEVMGTHISDQRLDQSKRRSRLVTAERPLSSSSPFPSSRASTRSSSEVLRPSRPDRRLAPHLAPPQAQQPLAHQPDQKRPRSRTLTAVHDAILADLVYPVEIVGKRMRTKEDGTKVLKIVLDEKERGGVDYRLDTYSEVYKRLTGKGVNFEFPVAAAEY
ncbi:unnamed protein product, partial [Aureobasidium pullulans]